MSINIQVLAESALNQALTAAKGHAKDLRAYLKKRAEIIAEGAAAIAKDHLEGKITKDEVKFAFDQIRESERSARLAIKVTAKVALQNAVNAALAVAAGAVNQAIGVSIL